MLVGLNVVLDIVHLAESPDCNRPGKGTFFRMKSARMLQAVSKPGRTNDVLTTVLFLDHNLLGGLDGRPKQQQPALARTGAIRFAGVHSQRQDTSTPARPQPAPRSRMNRSYKQCADGPMAAQTGGMAGKFHPVL